MPKFGAVAGLKPKKSKKKSVSTSQLKKKAWDAFSRYIRIKECREIGKCVTCNRKLTFKTTQAGHFITGRSNVVLFNEEIVHIQCSGCNIFLHGNINSYTIYMLDKYGEKKVREFIKLKGQILQYKKQDYIEIKEKYDKLYNDYKILHNILDTD